MKQITNKLVGYKYRLFAMMMFGIMATTSFFNVGFASQPSNMHSDINESETAAAFDRFFSEWKTFLAFLSGLTTLTCILTFIILMIKLAGASDNIIERPRVLREILVVLITAALAGSATVVFFLLSSGLLS